MVLIILSSPAVLLHVVEPGSDEPDSEIAYTVGRVKFRVSQYGGKRKSFRIIPVVLTPAVSLLGQAPKNFGNTAITLELVRSSFDFDMRLEVVQATHYGVGGIQANETKGSRKCGHVLFLFVQRIGQGVDGADMKEVGT